MKGQDDSAGTCAVRKLKASDDTLPKVKSSQARATIIKKGSDKRHRSLSAGRRGSTIAALLKAVHTPVPMEVDLDGSAGKTSISDPNQSTIIVEDDPTDDSSLKELREEEVASIRDGIEKWNADGTEAQELKYLSLAKQYLLHMNGTLCFFTVALRLLSLAPWKSCMTVVHIRQAAIAAVHRGWYVKVDQFKNLPFTRAELALAAASYETSLKPAVGDDPLQILFPMVNGLPIDASCDRLFATGSVYCRMCGSKCKAAFSFFSTCVTWKMQEWIDVISTLRKAVPFLWFHNGHWHKGNCARNDGDMHVPRFGPWTFSKCSPHAGRIIRV